LKEVLEKIANDAWYSKKPSFPKRLFSFLLLPITYLYLSVVFLKRLRMALCPSLAFKLPVPVISIGNLTLGGAAKTPTTILLAEILLRRGKKPGIVSRGYKGALEGETHLVSDKGKIHLNWCQAGDEPVMMAKKLPDVPVFIGADRAKAGAFALEKADIDSIVLDDAFQHMSIFRDLNILCVNGRTGFGNGRVFPSGPLREPLSAARSADICFINGKGNLKKKIEADLRRGGYKGEIVEIPYEITKFIPLFPEIEKQNIPVKEPCLAFASIAQPQFFFTSLIDMKVNVAERATFPDHHRYSNKDIAALDLLAKEQGIKYYVTTEKDGVKLIEMGHKFTIPVYMAEYEPKPKDEAIKIIYYALEGVL